MVDNYNYKLEFNLENLKLINGVFYVNIFQKSLKIKLTTNKEQFNFEKSCPRAQ